ncbi:MAG: SRPBCC domain-containing protein [Thermoleophilia bacterium]|nr:SRPBCC domain-containing protein [Thermoleophilia bacterium]
MTTAQELTVRKTVTVPLAPERAFELFTERIGEWWPLGRYSIRGDAAETAVFEPREGGRVYERTRAGEESEWARVLAYAPPSRFVLAWHVNPSRAATELEVRFTAADGGTRVDLEHRGWDSEESRSGYDGGWDEVLARYVAAAAAAR